MGRTIPMHVAVAVLLGAIWLLNAPVPAFTFEAPVSPAPPERATGELTAGERLFQGSWQMRSYESDAATGTLVIDRRDFQADGVHGLYTGYLSVRADLSPAEVDSTIEECDCKFEGMTSRGIFYEDDEGFVIAAPAPGEPRPAAFTRMDEMFRLRGLNPRTACASPS